MIPVIAGEIECYARIDSYSPGLPMLVTGWGMGDCEPPEPPEVLFTLCDEDGTEAHWITNQLTDREFEDVEETLLDALENPPYED